MSFTKAEPGVGKVRKYGAMQNTIWFMSLPKAEPGVGKVRGHREMPMVHVLDQGWARRGQSEGAQSNAYGSCPWPRLTQAWAKWGSTAYGSCPWPRLSQVWAKWGSTEQCLWFMSLTKAEPGVGKVREHKEIVYGPCPWPRLSQAWAKWGSTEQCLWFMSLTKAEPGVGKVREHEAMLMVYVLDQGWARRGQSEGARSNAYGLCPWPRLSQAWAKWGSTAYGSCPWPRLSQAWAKWGNTAYGSCPWPRLSQAWAKWGSTGKCLWFMSLTKAEPGVGKVREHEAILMVHVLDQGWARRGQSEGALFMVYVLDQGWARRGQSEGVQSNAYGLCPWPRLGQAWAKWGSTKQCLWFMSLTKTEPGVGKVREHCLWFMSLTKAEPGVGKVREHRAMLMVYVLDQGWARRGQSEGAQSNAYGLCPWPRLSQAWAKLGSTKQCLWFMSLTKAEPGVGKVREHCLWFMSLTKAETGVGKVREHEAMLMVHVLDQGWARHGQSEGALLMVYVLDQGWARRGQSEGARSNAYGSCLWPRLNQAWAKWGSTEQCLWFMSLTKAEPGVGKVREHEAMLMVHVLDQGWTRRGQS